MATTTDTTTIETSAPPLKPGWQSSELYLSIAAAILGILYAQGYIGTGGVAATVAGAASAVLSSFGYAVSRGNVKAAHTAAAAAMATTRMVYRREPVSLLEPASARTSPGFVAGGLMALLAGVGVTLALLPGCGAVQNGATAVIDCTIADGPKIEALVSDFEHKIINGTGTWATIEAEAEAAGKTNGGCALAEVVQTFLTAKTTQASTPAGSQAAAALEQFRIHAAGGATFHTSHGDL